jgi:hypothetical protein
MSSFRLSTSTTIIDKHFFQNTYANSTRLIHIIPSMLVYNASGSDFFFFTNASYHPPRHCFFLSCPFRHCYSLSSAGPSFPFLRWPILSFPPLAHPFLSSADSSCFPSTFPLGGTNCPLRRTGKNIRRVSPVGAGQGAHIIQISCI